MTALTALGVFGLITTVLGAVLLVRSFVSNGRAAKLAVSDAIRDGLLDVQEAAVLIGEPHLDDGNAHENYAQAISRCEMAADPQLTPPAVIRLIKTFPKPPNGLSESQIYDAQSLCVSIDEILRRLSEEHLWWRDRGAYWHTGKPYPVDPLPRRIRMLQYRLRTRIFQWIEQHRYVGKS